MSRDNLDNKKPVLNINDCYCEGINNEATIDIDNIKVAKRERVGFLINDDKQSFFNGNFWKILQNNKYQLLASGTSINKKYKFLRNKKVLNNIEFFEISSIKKDEIALPLYLQFQKIKDKFNVSDAIIRDFQSAIEKYNYTLKGIIFKLIKENEIALLDEFQKFDKLFGSLIKNCEEQLINNNYPEFLKLINETKDELEEFVINILRKTFDIYASFTKKFSILYKSNKENISFFDSYELSSLEKQYEFMKKIKNPTMINVKKELTLRDNLNGIKILNNLLQQMKNNARENMKYLIYKYRNAYKTDLCRANFFEKVTNQYQFLIKKARLEKYIYKFLRYNKKYMQYLSQQEINDLTTNLDFELKLFINNNLSSISVAHKNFSIAKIDKEINENFDFNIDNYISSSNKNAESVKENIAYNINNIKDIKKKLYKVKDNINFSKTINDLEIKIQRIKNEFEWRQENTKNAFLNTIQKDKRVLPDFKKIMDVNSSISKKMNYLISMSIFKKCKIGKKKIQVIPELNNSYQIIKTLKLINDSLSNTMKEIYGLKALILNRQISKKDKIIKYYLFASFIDIFNKSSIPLNNLVKPFEQVPYINKVKMGFISKLVKRPSLVIVEDDILQKDINLKLEIIRVCNELTIMNNIGFVFITDEKKTITPKYFDYVYMFVNNKEVEHGTVEEVMKHPVNPSVRYNLEKNHLGNMPSIMAEDYVYTEEISVNDDHYVIAPLKYFKRWTKNSSSSNKIKNLVSNERDQRKTIITKIDKLINPFLDLEALIINYKKNDKNLTSSYKLLTEYKNSLKNKNSQILTGENDLAY